MVGPGLCSVHLNNSSFTYHPYLGLFPRKIIWAIDKDSKKDFEFANNDGIVIDRNQGITPQKGPAFKDGGLDGGKYKYSFKSTGEYTLPVTDPGAPAFHVNLIRSKNGLACGEADPPIVNQP